LIVFKLCNFVVWEASVSLILFEKIDKYIFYLICFTRLLNIYIHVFYCSNYSQCLCIAQLSNNFFTLKLRCRLTWNLVFGKFRKGAGLPGYHFPCVAFFLESRYTELPTKDVTSMTTYSSSNIAISGQTLISAFSIVVQWYE